MTTTPAGAKSRHAASPARLRQVERVLFVFAVLATMFLVGVETWRLMPVGSPGEITAYSRRMAGSDADIGIIFTALRLKPTFGSTFAWWHERWAGPFNYWRPLTSQLYWLECHAFGPDRFDRWMAAMIGAHLLFTGLLAALVARLTGNRWAGLLAAYLFAGARQIGPFSAWMIGDIPSAMTTEYWKNEPEIWAGICAAGAILTALSGRWALAVVLAALSIGFKESGWLTWPLVFLALVPDGRFKTIPRWVYVVGLAISLMLFAFRCTIGWDIYAGNHATHNVNWLSRYLGQVGGAYVTDLDSVNAPAAVFSLALAALISWGRGHIAVRTLLAFGALFACAAWFGAQTHTDVTTGLGAFGDWNSGLSRWLFDLFYLLCASCLARSRQYRRIAAVLLVMILLSALPVVASVLVGNHTLYPTYGLQSALVALALIATARVIMRWVRSLKTEALSPKPREKIA